MIAFSFDFKIDESLAYAAIAVAVDVGDELV